LKRKKAQQQRSPNLTANTRRESSSTGGDRRVTNGSRVAPGHPPDRTGMATKLPAGAKALGSGTPRPLLCCQPDTFLIAPSLPQQPCTAPHFTLTEECDACLETCQEWQHAHTHSS